jgi:(p)ppGpp synthase/HD superfamily hydrolase
VEDQGGRPTLDLIRLEFGDGVADLVGALSDTEEQPKPPWRARKEAYIDHAKRAPASERLVSAADKLHNVRSILIDYRDFGDEVWRRFSGGKEGTLWYYRALVSAFGAGENGPGVSRLLAELDRAVTALESLAV